MNKNLQQAFEVANYMITLADQKRVLQEEFDQNSVYFLNGGCFKVNKELINFVKTLLDLGKENAVLIDSNSLPVEIADLKTFLDNILHTHFFAVNSYHTKYQKLKSSRTIEGLISI